MKIILVLAASLLGLTSYAQNKVEVLSSTIRANNNTEEVHYFSFAEGDQIVFDYKKKKRKLEQLEIIEYPSTVKFTDYNVKSIKNKRFTVSKTGVYKFRFAHNSKRDCLGQISIARIPASNTTQTFNTNVEWLERTDTTWNIYTKNVLVGYDTLRTQKVRKDLVNTGLKEEIIMDKSQKVHSEMNSNSNHTFLFFTLPENTETELVSKKIVSWAYWVGVGKEGDKAWDRNVKVISGLAKGVATYFTTPLGGFLAGQMTELLLPTSGDDVKYVVTDKENKDLYFKNMPYSHYDSGKGAAGYKKFTSPNMLKGTWYILLNNDNVMWGINVSVKVAALIETKTYKHTPYVEEKITPRYEKQIVKEPSIVKLRTPVCAK